MSTTATGGISGAADNSPPKATVKSSDMESDMQQVAVDTCIEAMDKYQVEKDIAAWIKKAFDKKYGPTWHVVVGKNFGSFVTHETKHFFYAYVGSVAVLIFKSG